MGDLVFKAQRGRQIFLLRPKGRKIKKFDLEQIQAKNATLSEQKK